MNRETPEEWNNIAIPVKKAMRNVIQTILAMDESTFEYQMKTNERLYKLQEQITSLKTFAHTETAKINEAVSMKFTIMNGTIDTQLDEMKFKVKESSDAISHFTGDFNSFQEMINLRINSFGKITDSVSSQINMLRYDIDTKVMRVEEDMKRYTTRNFEQVARRLCLNVDDIKAYRPEVSLPVEFNQKKISDLERFQRKSKARALKAYKYNNSEASSSESDSDRERAAAKLQAILPLYPLHNFDANRSLKDYTMLKLSSLEPFVI